MLDCVTKLKGLTLPLSLMLMLTGCSVSGKSISGINRHMPTAEFVRCVRVEYKENRHGECTKAALKIYLVQNVPNGVLNP